MSKYKIVGVALLNAVNRCYSQLPAYAKILGGKTVDNIKNQLMCALKGAEFYNGNGFTPTFNHNYYLSAIRCFKPKKGDIQKLQDLDACHKHYSCLDEVLLKTKKSPLFPAIFDKVENIFKKRVAMLHKLLYADGETFKKLAKNAFPTKEDAMKAIKEELDSGKDLLEYAKKAASLIDRVYMNEFEKAGFLLSEELKKLLVN